VGKITNIYMCTVLLKCITKLKFNNTVCMYMLVILPTYEISA